VTRAVGHAAYPGAMNMEFSGEIWFWRGPAPWHFISVPAEHCGDLAEVSSRISYGWGVIPVEVQIGSTRFTTSLFPKDGGYLVPVKAHVRKAEKIELGDTVTVRLAVGA
jgi:hypothetical protein